MNFAITFFVTSIVGVNETDGDHTDESHGDTIDDDGWCGVSLPSADTSHPECHGDKEDGEVRDLGVCRLELAVDVFA